MESIVHQCNYLPYLAANPCSFHFGCCSLTLHAGDISEWEVSHIKDLS